MKILLVVHTFLPKYIGGTEVCVFELAKEFIRKGHKVIVFCTDPLSSKKEGVIDSVKYRGIDVIAVNKNIKMNLSFSDTYSDNKVILPFSKIIESFKPDVIHYHHFMHLSIEMVNIGKKYKIPQVYTLHDFWLQCIMHQRITTRGELCRSFDEEKCSQCLSDIMNVGSLEDTPFDLKELMKSPNKSKFIGIALKKLYSRNLCKLKFIKNKGTYLSIIKQRNISIRKAISKIDLLIFPTKFLYHEFLLWEIKPNKFILSSDGIDTKKFLNFKRMKSNEVSFGYIGSIVKNKGLDMILKAWPKLDKGNYSLKIYGGLSVDKKYSQYILNLSKNLKNIKFLGTFPSDKISEVYSKIDVLIVPSRWFENAPLVIRNALQTKTPIIAVNLGSIPELVFDGKNGKLYGNEDLKGLISQMNYFIKNPNIIDTMIGNFSKQKSIEKNAEELLSSYKSIN